QTFTAPISGDYKLEVWGAQGGGWNNYGGLGGYSIGYKSLSTSNKLYVCVGSKGGDILGNTGGNGGYNGGGKGGNGCQGDYTYTIVGGGGGGGATHIATTDRGVLKNYKDFYELELLLVAGGGGGLLNTPGVGGGESGGNATSDGGTTIEGATQISGYAFGQGQDGKTKSVAAGSGAEGNGGGGGGLYGGHASQLEGVNSNCAGTGGSGYVGDVTNGATIAGNQTFPSPNGGTETGHSGDGYAIITWQQLP
ncbi:glycine rich domain-containing protein, partial [Segatella albensis]